LACTDRRCRTVGPAILNANGNNSYCDDVGIRPNRLWSQQDANHNVTSLVDNSGSVVQRQVYGPYGSVSFLTSAWASTTDQHQTKSLYQGGRWDLALGMRVFSGRSTGHK
jgi:hypothetical protein